MPTYEKAERFDRDFDALSPEEQRQFLTAVAKFVKDLAERKGQFRKGLRVKGMKRAEGVYEMTWAEDGRATFQYGESVREGEAHIIWRRVGTHDILGDP